MTTVIIFIVLLLFFLGIFLWMFKKMWYSACPVCQENEGIDSSVIPILPGYLWWCPNCNSTTRQNQLATRNPANEQE